MSAIKYWCETCEGAGYIDETLGGEHFSNPRSECPDCDGKGYWIANLIQPVQPVGVEKVSEAEIDELVRALTMCTDYITEYADEIERSARDAERYRWLIKNAEVIECATWHWWNHDPDVTSVTDRVDTAMLSRDDKINRCAPEQPE